MRHHGDLDDAWAGLLELAEKYGHAIAIPIEDNQVKVGSWKMAEDVLEWAEAGDWHFTAYVAALARAFGEELEKRGHTVGCGP